MGKGSGDFSIGSDVWPGLSKLVEEMGEVQQVAGKLFGAGGATQHWDGSNLRERLQEELADLLAAVRFVIVTCTLDSDAIEKRADEKKAQFWEWHRRGL